MTHKTLLKLVKLTRSKIKQQTKKLLQQQCEDLGLPQDGKKNDLFERLLESIEKHQTEQEEQPNIKKATVISKKKPAVLKKKKSSTNGKKSGKGQKETRKIRICPCADEDQGEGEWNSFNNIDEVVEFLTNEGRKSSKGAANNALKGRTRSHAGHYIRYVEVDEDLNEDQNITNKKNNSSKKIKFDRERVKQLVKEFNELKKNDENEEKVLKKVKSPKKLNKKSRAQRKKKEVQNKAVALGVNENEVDVSTDVIDEEMESLGRNSKQISDDMEMIESQNENDDEENLVENEEGAVNEEETEDEEEDEEEEEEELDFVDTEKKMLMEAEANNQEDEEEEDVEKVKQMEEEEEEEETEEQKLTKNGKRKLTIQSFTTENEEVEDGEDGQDDEEGAYGTSTETSYDNMEENNMVQEKKEKKKLGKMKIPISITSPVFQDSPHVPPNELLNLAHNKRRMDINNITPLDLDEPMGKDGKHPSFSSLTNNIPESMEKLDEHIVEEEPIQQNYVASLEMDEYLRERTEDVPEEEEIESIRNKLVVSGFERGLVNEKKVRALAESYGNVLEFKMDKTRQIAAIFFELEEHAEKFYDEKHDSVWPSNEEVPTVMHRKPLKMRFTCMENLQEILEEETLNLKQEKHNLARTKQLEQNLAGVPNLGNQLQRENNKIQMEQFQRDSGPKAKPFLLTKKKVGLTKTIVRVIHTKNINTRSLKRKRPTNEKEQEEYYQEQINRNETKAEQYFRQTELSTPRIFWRPLPDEELSNKKMEMQRMRMKESGSHPNKRQKRHHHHQAENGGPSSAHHHFSASNSHGHHHRSRDGSRHHEKRGRGSSKHHGGHNSSHSRHHHDHNKNSSHRNRDHRPRHSLNSYGGHHQNRNGRDRDRSYQRDHRERRRGY